MSDPRIANLSGVGPERTFLHSHPEAPKPTSTLYLERFTTKHADGTESHLVAGVHVRLAKGDPNGLWEALHVDRATHRLDPESPRVATRSLHLCCDTLEVGGAFCVPEAEVAVFARRVVWATDDASIDTSPLPWTVEKARDAQGTTPGRDGAHGRHAGPIRFFAAAMAPADGGGRKRLRADGGAGQHPGAGLDGRDGESRSGMTRESFGVRDKGKLWDVNCKATVEFSPPAVYIAAQWKHAGIVSLKTDNRGTDAFPTDGTDAVAPGAPGNGGNGGALETSLAAAPALLSNAAGRAGDRARDRRGGSAGTPSTSAKYSLHLKFDLFGTDNAGFDRSETGRHTTKAGKDAPAPPASKGPGASPKPSVVPEANAWLHPLAVQKALEYARDLFLADARDPLRELLDAYDAALALPVPEKRGAWSGAEPDALWTSAQAEIASMLQRLDAHLDYFGNPAGYMPLLSLQGAVRLYAEETRRALRTLLLVSAVGAKERSARQTEAALAESIATLNEDTAAAAARIVAAEEKAASLDGRIATLKTQLGDLSNELGALRTTLLSQARNDRDREARIRFGIHMAAAICQVVPVGQPVLGTLGSLAAATAGMVGKDAGDALPDTLSTMGGVLEKAAKAKGKAKGAKEKAEKKDEGEEKEGDEKEKAKKGASAWASVGKGLGPALSEASKAVKALKVPREEVEAELEKLETASPEWKKLTGRIRELNEAKAALFAELEDALQAVGESYARVSSNAAAVVAMRQARAGELGRLDPAATAFVRQMGQRSRLTLLKYLYLMVKSYETTVFRPLQVDWKLAEITDRISKLVQPKDGYDAGTLKGQADDLAPLFEQNLDTVRRKLLEEFSFGESTTTLQLGLSAEQTPGVLAALNDTGRIVLDPLAYGLVLPDTHLARLSRVVLAKLELDPQGPRLPDTHNMVITLQPSRGGTVRRGERLYAVHSDEPLRWSWTRLAKGEVRPSEPSKGAQDVLDLVLGTGAGAVRQKVALPPVWSELVVKVAFSPTLAKNRRPRITRLYFELGCDASPAPEDQRVLTVRAEGARPGVVIECAPGDLAGRRDAFDGGMRIYSAGAKAHLGVPDRAGEAAFQAWDLVGADFERLDVRERGVEVPLGGHVLALCRWTPAPAAPRLRGVRIAPASGAVAADAEVGAPAAPARPLPIRAGADAGAAVVGVAPSLAAVEVVEARDDGWTLVNHRGIVGWVDAARAAVEPEPLLLDA